MRLKSSVFVSAILRTEQGAGAFCSVIEHGADEAGAIFVIHRRKAGVCDFYGPAPQSFFEGNDTGRRFEKLASGIGDEEVRKLMGRQRDFDPDCWIIEIERDGELGSIELARDTPEGWPEI